MHAHGGETGGASIADALNEYEARGYTGQFIAQPGGILECTVCGTASRADAMHRRSRRRVEGASDPDDMCEIDALICPSCNAKGTAVFAYGTRASREESEVMALLRRVEQRDVPQMRSDIDDPKWPGV